MKYFSFIAACAFVIVPTIANAEGFIPCDGSGAAGGVPCTECHFVQMGNTILKWLIGVLFAVFAVVAAIGGFGLVTSGGNPEAKNDAKSKLVNALIGLIIVLAAWLLVDTVMRGLLSSGTDEITGYGPWSEVKCGTVAQSEWPGDPTLDSATVPLAGPAPTTCSGSACVALGIPCQNPSSCTISPDLVSKFQAFHSAAGVDGARVTEAMPPTRIHKSPCHQNGTCIDYSKSGGMTGAEVVSVINAAKANGLRPVYEVKTQAEKDSLVQSGASADDIKVLGDWISAPHFSIYGT